ncbi:hypothetical protein B5G28_14080 [Faecalibacterium sp. An77]|uniref:tape measure protein n=1 Tax=Faecalibacterium sp. An77 TaxID=1965655 RepID=UPI000B38816E|nr:tape measure protein [Faecalibacterium sp. An77]OUN32272.1 hypothetical protein B5G28_14080 [Faecalibacterium sp. An77]
MAQIIETLTLEDRFSATMSRYIRLMNQAAGITGYLKTATMAAAYGAAGFSSSAAEMAAASYNAAFAAATQTTQLAELTGQTDQLTEATDAATEAIEAQERQQRSLGSAAKSVIGTLKSMAASYLNMKGVQALVNASDQMTQINARLKLMTGSAEQAAAAQDEIFQAAQRSRGAYADMANMVTQLGMMAPDTFSNTGEIIAFAEQVQKQLAIAGADGAGAAAAITQLTQALASGTLRGEELNSVMDQATPIAQTIAEYMGVTTGQLREMASAGQVTADVVKNALLGAAEETNAAFEQIPLTWSQVWTMAQNTALQALEPVLNGISWLANNLETIAPIAAGAAAGLLAFAAASYVASGGLAKLIASITSINPMAVLIGAAVGVIVYHIAQWVQSVGGLRAAWLITVDNVASGVDVMKIKFMAGIYSLQNTLDSFKYSATSVFYGVLDSIGDFASNGLMALQTMANGAVDIINGLISKVNMIPGVAIDSIEKITLGSAFAVQNEAAKATRASTLAQMQADNLAAAAARAGTLAAMQATAADAHAERMAGIEAAQKATPADQGGWSGIGSTIPAYDPVTDALSGIGKDVKDIKKEATLSDEVLKELVDVATGSYIRQVNLGSTTTVINVNGQNTGDTKADTDAVIDRLKKVLAEQWAAGASRAIALPF